jgi:nucleotide-binding universal stress UspA family protein
MSGIVCAVRGGPESRSTIAKAIALAQANHLPLHFLYVVNIDFLEHTIQSRVHTITQEMQQMGEFILLTAQATAKAQGIESKGDVRHGVVTKEINRLCHEIQAEYLVIGRPKFHLEDSLFTKELLAEFIERIEEQTVAKVVIPETDES